MTTEARLEPQQIVLELRKTEVKIAKGKDVPRACQEAGATDESYYRWRRDYGDMNVDQAKRLKQLEQESAGLKRLMGELPMERAVLREVAKGNC